MASLSITISEKDSKPKKYTVEMNADQFERMAAQFGFLRLTKESQTSIKRGLADYRAGRVHNITSLSDLD